MDFKKIGILGGIAAGAYFLSKKVVDIKQKIEEDIEVAKDKLDSLTYEAETVLEDLNNTQIPPAEKYIKIIPYADFTEVAGKLWIGTFRWDIVNTSKDITFVIDRIRSNFYIDGNLGEWVPGHRNLALKLKPGESREIYSTWQDREWLENSAARDAVRDVLRENIDKWVPILTSDIELWISQVGQYEQLIAKWKNVQGSVRLRSGGVFYFDPEGENAINWGDPEYEESIINQILEAQG